MDKYILKDGYIELRKNGFDTWCGTNANVLRHASRTD